MLCWYYIAKLTLVTDGSDKALDIALKALDVAKIQKSQLLFYGAVQKTYCGNIPDKR